VPSATISGYCGNCGVWGHRSRECNQRRGAAVNTIVPGSEDTASMFTAGPSASQVGTGADGQGLILSILRAPSAPGRAEDAASSVGSVLAVLGCVDLLIDSGACTHVCPTSFMSFLGTEGPHVGTGLVAANGGPIKVTGTRTVPLMVDGTLLSIAFTAAEVDRVILSVPTMVSHGWQVTFSSTAVTASLGNTVLHGIRTGEQFIFRAKLPDEVGKRQAPQHALKLEPATVRHVLPVTMADSAVAEVPAEGRPEERPDAAAHSAAAAGGTGGMSDMSGVGVELRESEDDTGMLPVSDAEPEEEGERPRVATAAAIPSDIEVARHNTTHIPYRAWCTACQTGRARGRQHRRRMTDPEGHPQVQMDYSYMRTEGGPLRTILIAVHRESGSVLAATCFTKGGTDLYALRCVLGWLQEVGLTSTIRLRTDAEPAIMDLAARVGAAREGARTLLEQAPAGSHQSVGSAERHVGLVAAHVRTLLAQLEEGYGVVVSSGSVLFAWTVRHAAWTLSRASRRQCGRTPFQIMTGRPYTSELVPFGTTVRALTLGAAKASSAWVSGVWLGRSGKSDEHLVATERGIKASRSIAVLPQPWAKDVLMTAVGAPWHTGMGPGRHAELPKLLNQSEVPGAAVPHVLPHAPVAEPARPAAAQASAAAADHVADAQQGAAPVEPPPPPAEIRQPKRPKVSYSDFVQQTGRTPDCKACVAPHGRVHVSACRKRFVAWQSGQDMQLESGQQLESAGQAVEVGGSRVAGGGPGAGDADVDMRAAQDPAPTAPGSGTPTVAGPTQHSAAVATPAPAPPLASTSEGMGRRPGSSTDAGAGQQPSSSSTDVAMPPAPAEVAPRLERVTGPPPEIADMPPPAVSDPKRHRLYMVEAGVGPIGEVADEFHVGVPDLPGEGLFGQTLPGEQPALLVEGLPKADVEAGMAREMASMGSFNVFEEASEREVLAAGHKIIGTRWVHRAKEGVVKSRLVAQEFNTGPQADLHSATPTHAGLRLLLAIAHMDGLQARVGDFSTAFLHAEAEENTFVRPPASHYKPGVVWRLRKALYGLRRAPLLFQELLCKVLTQELGFTRCLADGCVYRHGTRHLFVGIHVDDPLAVGSAADVGWLFQKFAEHFLFKAGPVLEIGTSVRYLGKMYERTPFGFIIRTPAEHIQSIMATAGMEQCSVAPSPEAPGGPREVDHELLDPAEHRVFRQIVGKLLFISTERPDLQHACRSLSRKLVAPTVGDMIAAKRVIRFLAGDRDAGLHLRFPQSSSECTHVEAFSDSNWAVDPEDRKSVSSCIVMLGQAVIVSCCRTQTVVALSSAEAELIASTMATCEAMYVRTLLSELGVSLAVRVHIDASACIAILHKTGLSGLKHISVRLLHMQRLVREKIISIQKIAGELNCADLNTKIHSIARYQLLRQMIGMR